MKRPHLLRVEAEPSAFATLIEAVEAAGLRVGWLELDSKVPAPGPLADATAAGALRSVAVTADGAISVKRRRGDWVLEDLLREHFAGFRCVLVVGGGDRFDSDAIEPTESGEWRLTPAGGTPRTVTAESFIARLRKPLQSG